MRTILTFGSPGSLSASTNSIQPGRHRGENVPVFDLVSP